MGRVQKIIAEKDQVRHGVTDHDRRPEYIRSGPDGQGRFRLSLGGPQAGGARQRKNGRTVGLSSLQNPVQRLSVVVPCYNEAGNLDRFPSEVVDVLRPLTPE